ncbi:hypothetical protein OIU84_024938 [Salix udensis]|uniref:Uncharacterized protein n=1 Tax=Salix udensis TaxID=889485 RepID=A0AAD6PC39_9ROSI|nr:hypothetical protein OIU84_024938 [Salix udensis]
MPFFHVFGFFYIFKSVALSETMVVMMERFELKKMLRGVEEFKITLVASAPPVVVAMAKTELVGGYDIKSPEMVARKGFYQGGYRQVSYDIDLWQANVFNKETLKKY